jgi:hypothetical protein
MDVIKSEVAEVSENVKNNRKCSKYKKLYSEST